MKLIERKKSVNRFVLVGIAGVLYCLNGCETYPSYASSQPSGGGYSDAQQRQEEDALMGILGGLGAQRGSPGTVYMSDQYFRMRSAQESRSQVNVFPPAQNNNAGQFPAPETKINLPSPDMFKAAYLEGGLWVRRWIDSNRNGSIDWLEDMFLPVGNRINNSDTLACIVPTPPRSHRRFSLLRPDGTVSEVLSDYTNNSGDTTFYNLRCVNLKNPNPFPHPVTLYVSQGNQAICSKTFIIDPDRP